MKANADRALRLILKHEGGYVDHPKDPGGATNRGVTIGTLKRLGIDKDGDGDSDVVDLKLLTEAEAVRVFKAFYWDAVQADLLPSGLDYAVADFAVNSGPVRAAQYLQRILGVEDDGHIGPKTLAAVAKANPAAVITALTERRLTFLRGLSTWNTFKGGWQRRVGEVRDEAMRMAAQPPQKPASAPTASLSTPAFNRGVDAILKPSTGPWARILAALVAFFTQKEK
jgi:lysozyme family protein